MEEDGVSPKENEATNSRPLAEAVLDLRVQKARQEEDGLPHSNYMVQVVSNGLHYSEKYLAEHPEATLAELTDGFTLSMADSPSAHTQAMAAFRKVAEPVELTEEEKVLRNYETINLNRGLGLEQKTKETIQEKEMEQGITNNVLEKGRFVVNFSAVVSNKDGDTASAGFKTFASPHPPSDEKYVGNPLQEMFPGQHLRDYETRNLLNTPESDHPPILEAVTIRPLHKPETKQVETKQKKRVRSGLFGTKNVMENVTENEFVRNAPTKMKLADGREVFASEIMYQTTTRFIEGADDLYTDENGRPGNILRFRLVVPNQLAQQVSHMLDQDPSSIRKLVRTAVLDEKRGCQAALSKNTEGNKISDGLPDYEGWPESRMIIDSQLRVPDYDTSKDPPKTDDEMKTEVSNKSVVINK